MTHSDTDPAVNPEPRLPANSPGLTAGGFPDKLRVLDLFSGIGGFSLGLERTGGFETVAFCEIEPFPRHVLAKHWPEIYCHDDVRTLTKETLCSGYAENALLNRLCRETGGSPASVKGAIGTIKESFARKTPVSTTNGLCKEGVAFSTTMAGNVPAAESENTRFWQLITSTTTGTTSEQNTSGLLGKSLSRADCLTIIKFFVTIATQQNPSTVPAPIREMAGVSENDVRTLTADVLRRDGIAVDVITGGFPCQDISLAGKQAGVGEGTRSGLFSEVIRLAGDIRPGVIILENVANLLSGPSKQRGGWFGRVLGALAAVGYDAVWDCLPAGNLGAPHERDRVWIVAYPSGTGLERLRSAFGDAAEISDAGCHLAGANAAQIQRLHGIQHGWIRAVTDGMDQRPAWGGQQWPQAEPLLCRVDDGIPDRVGRTAACGNAVVPQIPELIGRAILQARQAQ